MLKEMSPLEPIPISHGIRLIKIDPSAKYICFLDAEVFGHDSMLEHFIMDPSNPLPVGTPVYMVRNIEHAVKIYEVLDTKVGSNHA